jgi:putative thioredoxin
VIFDVAESEFEQRVVEGSRQRPVVVDFWAEWCGPCRTLTPALEAAARKREGQVDLAKVDVDANQQLAASFGIQGIPAVKAFRDGEVADQFVGAQPPARVEEFFDRLVPSPAEQLVDDGDEQSLRKALELEPGRPDAALPLARLLLERGEREEARRLLERVPDSFQADGLAARIRLEEKMGEQLADALAALDAGERERALDLLLEAVGQAADGRRDDLRKVIVGVLDEFGPGDPTAGRYRRRLASVLY